tara:strand:- start:29 stop:1936 length:1908 start_codon:yes stop_codon:yes gene_type:complete
MSFQVDMNLTGSPFYDSNYYLADSPGSFSSSKYYQPFIRKLPTLSIGNFEQGWLRPSYGILSIDNLPTNSKAPFSGKNFGTLVDTPQTAIPMTFYWNGDEIAQVTGILSKMNESELSFQLEAPVSSFNLLRLYLAETTSTAEFLEITDNGSGKCRILFKNLHPYNIGEGIFFVGMDVVATELESDGSSDTLFQVIDIPTETSVDIDIDFSLISVRNPLTADLTIAGGTDISSDTFYDYETTLDSPLTIESGATLTITQTGTLSVASIERRLPEITIIPPGKTLTVNDLQTCAISGSGEDQPFYDSGSASSSDSQLPFAFGTIDLRSPAIKLNTSETQIGNPNLLISLSGNPAGVQDDGQSKPINISNSTDFATVQRGRFPTLELSSGAVTGVASVSGTTGFIDRANGDSTVADFFNMVGNSLGYSLNFDLAPNADSSLAELSVWETRQQRLIDFSDVVAIGMNHQFYLNEETNVLHVIDLANIPSLETSIFYEQDILKIGLELPGPIAGIRTTRNYNLSLGAGTSASPYQLYAVQRYVRISVLNTGLDKQIRSFASTIQKATIMMNNIRNVFVRPRIVLSIVGVNTSILPGSKIKFYSDTLGVSGNFFVRRRSWDFAQETTEFAGDAVLDSYTQA